MRGGVRNGLLLSGVLTLVWAVGMSAEAPTGGGGASDPFVGAYVGTLDPTGIKNKDKVTTRPDCGTCHAAGEISREASEYVLVMTLQQSSNRKDARVTLKGRREGDRVLFQSDKYALTASAGRLVGERKGTMVGTLDLTFQGAASRPASLPATRP